MCVDFRDLNKACQKQKEDFPLPHIDQLNVAGKRFYTILDLFAGYNPILMALVDMEKTAFTTQNGEPTDCYRVCFFGLKNAEATYQRMATALFHDMIHNDEVEVYFDNMVIATAEEHIT